MGEVTQDTIHTPHTPGPWKYDRKNLRDNGVSVQGPDGHRICRVFSRPQDADLIAAAPDLLAALKAVVGRSSGHLYATDQETGETFDALARAAIARAEGRAA